MLTVAVRTNTSGIGSGGQPMIEKYAKTLHIFFSIVATNVNSPGNANPYVAGGDTLDLTALFGDAGLPGYSAPTASMPEKVLITSIKPSGSAQAAGLFEYRYALGTTGANGKMQVFTTGGAAQAALVELTAGNYPAGVLGDVIEGEVIVPVP